MTLHAFTDGASRGNPGESGIGVIVRDDRGNVVLKVHGYIGESTNNIAEYTALLALLKRAGGLACTHLVVHSDSELMVRQVSGDYRVKDTNLQGLYRKVMRLVRAAPYEFELRHIPREQNVEADRLANAAINERKRIRI